MIGLKNVTRYVLPLLAIATALCAFDGRIACAKLRALPDTDSLLQHGALIAHVRVAGSVSFGDRTVQVVEILDAARGPGKGQLALLECEGDDFDGAALPNKVGGQFILFAKCTDEGIYEPPRFARCILPVAVDGAVAGAGAWSHLLPPQTPPTAQGVMAQLRAACQRQRATLSVRINEHDVANYEAHRPLRVEITVKNAGAEEIRFQNHITYEYRHNAFIDRGRLEKMQEVHVSPPVRICIRPLGRRHELRALEKVLERLSEEVALAPGERATGSYDLGEEFDLHGGGSFAVWAEWGGQRSPAVLLQLPETGIEEALAKEELLAPEGEGPFRVQRRENGIRHSMPAVAPVVEGAAIEAALAYWFGSRLGGRHHALADETDEVVVLRSAHISPEFAPTISGIQFLASDAGWLNDGKPARLTTSRGAAVFHWRTVRVKSVHVQGASATIEVIQNERHNLGGSGATINLRRRGAAWRVDGEVLVWQS